MIAITSGVKDMQAVLNLVWDKLLPALKPSPLAVDDAAREKLLSRLAGLTLRPQEGSRSPSHVAKRTYVFPANERKLESIALEDDGDGHVLVARIDGAIGESRAGWAPGRRADLPSARP